MEIASGSKTIISGYDAEDDIYYVTLSPIGNFEGYTIGYDDKGRFWQGTYTFMPDRYASLKDSFLDLSPAEVASCTSFLIEPFQTVL